VTDEGLRLEESKQVSAGDAPGELGGRIGLIPEALKRSPQSAELHRLYARVLSVAGQQDKSATQLREAVRLNPRDERSRIALADVQVVSRQADAGTRDASRDDSRSS
jgi:protein involved in temperature-dependent protein secretion